MPQKLDSCAQGVVRSAAEVWLASPHPLGEEKHLEELRRGQATRSQVLRLQVNRDAGESYARASLFSLFFFFEELYLRQAACCQVVHLHASG